MKLVAPVYTLAPLQERVFEFKGLNKKSVIDDGEMRDMYNLSSDEYPCLYQRKPRGVFSESYQRPTAMIVKDGKLAVISDGKFYYNGVMEPGLSLSDKTQMVSINMRICFFPEKMFYNIKTKETGSLSAKIEMETECSISSSTITFESASKTVKTYLSSRYVDVRKYSASDGGSLPAGTDTSKWYTVIFEEQIDTPESYFKVGRNIVVSGWLSATTKNEGHINLLTSRAKWSLSGTVQSIDSLKVVIKGGILVGEDVGEFSLDHKATDTDLGYLLSTDTSIEKSVTAYFYGEIMATTTIDDESFTKGDAIEIYIEGWSEGGDPFETSAIVEEIGKTYIKFPDDTFIGVIAEGKTSIEIASGIVRFERKCPDLDFVVESNNRLWGVSNADNTIYACKLGDPTNWAYFQNTSLDSYYAEQGTDGEWTGCAAYSSHLLFFKADYIHRLYGSRPSEFQTDTMECHGLEGGSEKSIAIINDVVMYKSRVGIMAYSGGTPVLISDSFGTGKYKDAVAGTDRFKYYVSLINDDTPEFYVYDMSRHLWHKEDNARARAFAYLDGKLLFIDDVSNSIYQIDASSGSNEIEWMAQLGPFDEFVENKKIYSKLKMRLNFEELSELKLFISIDDGEWELIGNVNARQGRTLTVPIVPRRCNRFAIKLEGKGYCKIESIVRQYRQGRR